MRAPASTTRPIDFETAGARVNEWRGQMVENFSRAEHAVTEALLVFNSIKPEIKGSKFPHLVGKRFNRLAVCLAAITTPSSHVVTASSALCDFRTHEPLRAMLCHGVTNIALDRSGAWVAILRLVTFKAGSSAVSCQTLEEAEAKECLERLIGDRRRLCTALGQVRREIAAAS